jgi:LDH2 family malate/lactate/ureidoglycolate dehydrogenase
MATELISIDELDGIVLKAMINLGYPEDEAHVIKDILMAAELRNNSQGISKLYDVSSPGSLKYNSEVRLANFEGVCILAFSDRMEFANKQSTLRIN